MFLELLVNQNDLMSNVEKTNISKFYCLLLSLKIIVDFLKSNIYNITIKEIKGDKICILQLMKNLLKKSIS